MSKNGYHYLNKEIRHMLKEIDDQLQIGSITLMAHALRRDVLHQMQARIKVAKLIDKRNAESPSTQEER